MKLSARSITVLIAAALFATVMTVTAVASEHTWIEPQPFTWSIVPGIVVTDDGSPIRTVRLAGDNRYHTSALANRFFYDLDGAAAGTTLVVVGQKRDGTAPDALAAVAPDNLKQLVGPDGLPPDASDQLCFVTGVKQVVVYGGIKAVTDAAVQQVVDRLNGDDCDEARRTP